MAKSTLKLSGTYPMWGPGVRTGKMGRVTGGELPVLVRVEDVEATTELLTARREEARLLARASSAGLLRLEQVVVVGGKIARVYEGCDGVSLPRVREHLAARGEAIPARVALGLAAAVGHALETSLGLSDGDRAVAAPSWIWDDVLVEPGGRVRVARLTTASTSSARASAAARVVAGVALEAIAGPLPGREPPDIEVALARVTAAGAPIEVARTLSDVLLLGQGTSPGALARALDALGADMHGPTLSAWAPGVVSAAMRASTGATDSNAPGPALLPDATGIVPRRPATRAVAAPVAAPLPEASRPFERAAGRVRLEDIDADPPTTVLRSVVPGRLDALVNDVDEAEATVVGIARIRDAGMNAERDLLDITGSFRAAAPAVSAAPAASVAPPPDRSGGGTSSAVTLLAGLAAGLLLVLVAAFVLRDGGAEDPPVAGAVDATNSTRGAGTAPVDVPPPATPPSPGPSADGGPRAAGERPAPGQTARKEPAPGRAVAAPAGDRPVPAAQATPETPATVAPPAAASGTVKHAVTFQSGSPAIVSLEVDCMEGRGKGASVTIPSTPTGNCRITGRTAEGGKTTVMFTVASSGTFTCFTDGARDCR